MCYFVFYNGDVMSIVHWYDFHSTSIQFPSIICSWQWERYSLLHLKFWKWSLCFNLTLCHTVIGPEYLHNFFNQSDLKLKPVVTWSLAFSCASISLLVFSVSSLRANYEILLSVHWLLWLLWVSQHLVKKRSTIT